MGLNGSPRTSTPTRGMRVAEDVDPYKKESNILMRRPLCEFFSYLISDWKAMALPRIWISSSSGPMNTSGSYLGFSGVKISLDFSG